MFCSLRRVVPIAEHEDLRESLARYVREAREYKAKFENECAHTRRLTLEREQLYEKHGTFVTNISKLKADKERLQTHVLQLSATLRESLKLNMKLEKLAKGSTQSLIHRVDELAGWKNHAKTIEVHADKTQGALFSAVALLQKQVESLQSEKQLLLAQGDAEALRTRVLALDTKMLALEKNYKALKDKFEALTIHSDTRDQECTSRMNALRLQYSELSKRNTEQIIMYNELQRRNAEKFMEYRDTIQSLTSDLRELNQKKEKDDVELALFRARVAEINGKEQFVPCDFICPISGSIMENPEFTPCGHVFEGENIGNWLRRSRVCPTCRAWVSFTYPAVTFKSAIQEYLAGQGEENHFSWLKEDYQKMQTQVEETKNLVEEQLGAAEESKKAHARKVVQYVDSLKVVVDYVTGRLKTMIIRARADYFLEEVNALEARIDADFDGVLSKLRPT